MHIFTAGTTLFSILTVASATADPAAVFADMHSINCAPREGKYLSLPADQQDAYWIGRFEHYKTAWQDLLNETQLAVADMAIDLARLPTREEKKAKVPEVKDAFRNIFGGTATRDMFTSFRDMDPDREDETEDGEAPGLRRRDQEVQLRDLEPDPVPICRCTTQDPYCYGGDQQAGGECYLHGRGCLGSNGAAECGTMYLFECDGSCYLS